MGAKGMAALAQTGSVPLLCEPPCPAHRPNRAPPAQSATSGDKVRPDLRARPARQP